MRYRQILNKINTLDYSIRSSFKVNHSTFFLKALTINIKNQFSMDDYPFIIANSIINIALIISTFNANINNKK